MGYLSFVIVPFPYIIVCILFIRGITLEGSFEGIKYYLLNPDFNKLLTASTWASALKQLMFSMNIGYGGLISLSSYSKPDNNFFRDCLIVIFGDTIMSVVGGVAVFSVLGYLSQMTGKSIPEVVDQGASLAFIVYPEAISTMTTPYIWNSLFFMMLFFLGISSEIALVEVFTGLIFDCFPSTRKRGWVVTVITCTVCFLGGLLFCFHSGWFWFNLADDFMGSVCSCLVATTIFVDFELSYLASKKQRFTQWLLPLYVLFYRIISFYASMILGFTLSANRSLVSLYKMFY